MSFTRRHIRAAAPVALMFLCALGALPARWAFAETAFRVCSQNLHRFGEQKKGYNQRDMDRQAGFLIRRMQQSRCDIVGVQEVIGGSRREAQATLEQLAGRWSEVRGEPIEAVVGDSDDDYIRNGFLVPASIARTAEVRDFLREPIPRLQPLGPIARFLRAPVALVFPVPGGKRLFVLNVHLKSKSRGFKDPTGTDFETVRMESSEAVRSIIRKESAKQPQNTIFVVLGDRNSDLSSGAAAVMSGRRTLEDFRNGACRLNEDEEPDCGDFAEHSPALVGLFEHRRRLFPGEFPGGSYRYRGRNELLDEIFLRPESLGLATRPDGTLSIGFEGEYYKGSDHKLVWAELRW